MTADLFGETLDGIAIQLEHRGCAWCRHPVLVISGPGGGPHAAALTCPRCCRNGGWLQKGAATFIINTVKQFGRPEKPIVVRAVMRNSRTA